jgi:hypothetical protein
MSEIRKVAIHIDANKQTSIKEIVGREKFFDAIGYLSTWNMTYPSVDIYTDGDTDMVAVYKDVLGVSGYVIGAVWHEDHYGFHS